MLNGLSMTRKAKKPTIAQLGERMDNLELAMGEVQQFLNLIAASAQNDILRHETILKELCENAGVEFKEHEQPEPDQHEKVEESQGGSD